MHAGTTHQRGARSRAPRRHVRDALRLKPQTANLLHGKALRGLRGRGMPASLYLRVLLDKGIFMWYTS